LKLTVLTVILAFVLALDLVTKSWALRTLVFERGELFGGLVPLTLAFNKGAAFGISVGDDSRWLFVPITFVALGLLGVLFKQAERGDWLRITAISLVVSGALGNLYDRLRWDRGVVDFIGPLDLGFWYFPIFNVADMAISCGAVMLAISFWVEEKRLAEREAAEAAASEGATAAAGDGSQSAGDRVDATHVEGSATESGDAPPASLDEDSASTG
jgi:signal peptidase II